MNQIFEFCAANTGRSFIHMQRGILKRTLQQIRIKRFVIFQIAFLLAFFDLIQRRLGNIDIATFDQLS